MYNFKRLNRELAYKGSIIDYYVDTIQLPDGRQAKWDHISHNGAAAVIAVTDENKILLVRQYRNSIDRQTLEIPAGGVQNINEPTKYCAARELEEETGYKANELEFLIKIKTAIAFTNENIDIYIAKGLKKTQQNLDPDEFIAIEEFDLDTLLKMIFSGELQDSKTVSAILAYHYKLQQDCHK